MLKVGRNQLKCIGVGIISLLIVALSMMAPTTDENINPDEIKITIFDFIRAGIDEMQVKHNRVVIDAEGQPILLTVQSKVFHIGVMSGQSFKLNFVAPLGLHSASTDVELVLEQAPGTTVKNQIFTGVSLEIRNSPNSVILNNTFTNIEADTFAYGLRIVNSSNSIVEGNVFDGIALTNLILHTVDFYYTSAIVVETSIGVFVRNNIVKNLYGTQKGGKSVLVHGIRIISSVETLISENYVSQLSAGYSVHRVFAIYVFKSSNTNISKNIVEGLKVSGSLYFSYLSGMYIERSNGIVVEFNQILNITTMGSSISAGIRFYNSHNLAVSNNLVGNLSSGYETNGIYLSYSSIGTLTKNTLQFLNGSEHIRSTAFRLDSTTLMIIQDNIVTNVEQLVALTGNSTENIIYNNLINGNLTGSENDAPIISHVPSITYVEGDTRQYLIFWLIIDTDPATYQLYFQNSLIEQGIWKIGTPVVANASFLPKGTYNFTLVAFDAKGHFASETVLVFVQDSLEFWSSNLNDNSSLISKLKEALMESLSLETISHVIPLSIFIFVLVEFLPKTVRNALWKSERKRLG